ncbi:MAG: ribbon-helix-helix domain-containing protein [Planctomycetota bacterium]
MGKEPAPERKPYLVRLPPDVLEQLRGWASQEMRSINGQIEYLLRQALAKRRGASGGDDSTSPPPPASR